MHKSGYANLQYVASASFLLTTYAKYMAAAKRVFYCQSLRVTSKSLRAHAKKQVNNKSHRQKPSTPHQEFHQPTNPRWTTSWAITRWACRTW